MNPREVDFILDQLEVVTGSEGRRNRQKILTCLESPTIETWDDVCNLVLRSEPAINYAQAVQAIDPQFVVPNSQPAGNGCQKRNWTQPPSAQVLLRALRYATVACS